MKLDDAVQVTVVTPGAKVAPEVGVQVTATGPSTSWVAPEENVTTAPAPLVR